MSKKSGAKSERIFALRHAGVKENPIPERDFKRAVQNSAHDLQNLDYRLCEAGAAGEPTAESVVVLIDPVKYRIANSVREFDCALYL
jgi:hypothetical protein